MVLKYNNICIVEHIKREAKYKKENPKSKYTLEY